MKKRIYNKIWNRVHKGIVIHLLTSCPLDELQEGYYKLMKFGKHNHILSQKMLDEHLTTKRNVYSYVKHLYDQIHHVKYYIALPHNNKKCVNTWDSVILTPSANSALTRYLRTFNNFNLMIVSTILFDVDGNPKTSLNGLLRDWQKDINKRNKHD